MLSVIDLKKTLFLVLSRTGNTAETNSLMIWLIDYLSKKAGKTSPGKQIVLATDPERSTLTPHGTDRKIAVIPVPTNLSGRFSLLHACSLFPAALCGIDIKACWLAPPKWMSVPVMTGRPKTRPTCTR